MINRIFGIALFIIGVILLGYSFFLLFFQEPKKNITALLPREGFEVLMSVEEALPGVMDQHPIGSLIASITKGVSFSHGIVAGYRINTSSDLEYIFIFESDKKPAFFEHCQLAKRYYWCSLSRIQPVDWIIEKIEKKSPPLSSWDYFEKNRFLFDQHNSISFIGASSFLLRESFLHGLSSDPITQQKIYRIINGIIPIAPLFSGGIRISENTYSLALHKKNAARIYPNSSTQNSFNAAMIPKEAGKMIMLQSPYSLWEYAKHVATPSDFPLILEWQQASKEMIQQMFSQKLSWNQDIIPLLKHDMLIFSDTKYTSALFLLPSQLLAKSWYEKMSTLLLAKAAEKIPTKKEHVVADGTRIVEIFPEQSSIVPQKRSVPQGEGVFFSAPLEVETKVFPSAGYAQNALFISQSSSYLDLFLAPHDTYTILPKETPNVFLVFRWKSDAASSGLLPIIEANGLGKEQDQALIFEWSMKIDSRGGKKPIEGVLSTPFPTLP